MQSNSPKFAIPWPFIGILIIVTLLVISGGILFYKSQKKKIKYEKQNELSAIITLKAGEIAKWRMEHIRDGESISNDKLLNRQIKYFFENEGQNEIKKELLNWMQSSIRNYDYQSIFLLDNSGIVRLSYPEKEPALFDLGTLKGDIRERVEFIDLHTSSNASDIHIDLVIPLISSENNGNRIIGTIAMKIDPEITLFPLIQAWPTPSKSSETLLLRREGDSVLYLNNIRHQANTALKLKIPLSNKTLPAAVAATGYEGPFEGRDYRNIPVISSLKKIPGSPWFMVAKVDKDEIYSSLKELVILILIMAFLIILSAGALIGFYLKKENEIRLRDLNFTKDKFFSIISHDLKSPFTSIIGFSELLVERMEKKDFNGTEEFGKIIHSSSLYAMDLLNNLTQWSRLQTGKIEFKPVKIDIVSIINDVIELMNASAINKSITIVRNIPAQLTIMADGAMISTVLRNLISNSIKFTKPGGEIIISAQQLEEHIRLEVRDNGVGIKKEIIPKLFLIEEDVSTNGTINEEGTGLGLILCKEFISIHGGKIWVESEVEKGSRFIFSIPL